MRIDREWISCESAIEKVCKVWRENMQVDQLNLIWLLINYALLKANVWQK